MNLLILVCYQKENLPRICGHDLPTLVQGRTGLRADFLSFNL